MFKKVKVQKPASKTARDMAVEARFSTFRLEFKKNGGNAREAAIAAGYSPHSATTIGVQLSKRLGLRDEQDRESIAIIKRNMLEEEDLVRSLASIVNFDPRRLFDEKGMPIPLHELPDDVAAAVSSFRGTSKTVKGKRVDGPAVATDAYDKLTAIDKAMRFRGMFAKDNGQRKADAVPVAVQFNFVRHEKEKRDE